MRRATSVFLFLLVTMPPAFAGSARPSYVQLQDAPTITVDWSKGDTQAVTLHGDRKIVFVNGQRGERYMLVVRQDATGDRKLSWPSNLVWPGGPPHTSILTTTRNKKDFLSLFYDGERYDVLAMAQNY